METNVKGETKFPLGKDLFLSVAVWRGRLSIHIRKYKAVKSFTDPDQCIVVPTRYGICMDQPQLETLIRCMPSLLSEIRNLTTLGPEGKCDEDGVLRQSKSQSYPNLSTEDNNNNNNLRHHPYSRRKETKSE